MQFCLFCCQRHLKFFLRNYRLCLKSKHDGNNKMEPCQLRQYDAILTDDFRQCVSPLAEPQKTFNAPRLKTDIVR